MIAYRYVSLDRAVCQSSKCMIRWAAVALRIRESLGEIRSCEIQNIPLFLEDQTLCHSGRLHLTPSAKVSDSHQIQLSRDFLERLAEFRFHSMARCPVRQSDLFPGTTLNATAEHISHNGVTLHQELINEDFRFQCFPRIPRRT